jgi:hypothetical protein
VIGDFNGDAKPDIVTATRSSNSVSILLGNGDGTFQANAEYPAGPNPEAVATADVNGDGKLDLVTTNYFAHTVSVLLGSGNGTFQIHGDYGTDLYPFTVAVGDVSGDGRPDIVTGNIGATVSILAGNGDGTFQTKVDHATPSYARCVAIATRAGMRPRPGDGECVFQQCPPFRQRDGTFHACVVPAGSYQPPSRLGM